MRIIQKKDLGLIDGFLVDQQGNVITMPNLAAQANEVMELIELIAFVKKNKKDILASKPGKRVEFVPSSKVVPPVLKSGKIVKTPLNDAAEAEAKARALEFLDKKNVENIDEHLSRYFALAKWFNQDYIEYTDKDAGIAKFVGDFLKLTEKDVVTAVEQYHDEEIRDLIKLVNIDFS